MKMRSVGAELFHADEQTDKDMTKLIFAFRNFANSPKNSMFMCFVKASEQTAIISL
jgi:hypothetical protein